MGIKWKSSDERKMNITLNKSLKGILIILLCTAIVSTAMCFAYPYFRGRATANINTYMEERGGNGEQDATYEVDEAFLRYMLSSIYYMNYEMTPDMDAYTYFTQNYDMGKFTEAERTQIKEAASRLMKNMRNQYSVMQNNFDFASYGSGPARDFGMDGYLNNVIRGNSEDARQYYHAGILIQYDSRGVPQIRESWGMSMDERKVLGYLQQASMMRLLEDNGMDSESYVYEDVVVESTGEEYDDVYTTTYTDAYENAERNDSLLKTIPLPVVQNTSFAFGLHVNEENDYAWRDYWVERNAYMRSGYSVGALAIIAAMILLALVLQNLPALELRKNRLFCLPTELVVWCGWLGIMATFAMALTDFGIYSMTSSIVEDFESVGFGNAAQTAATVFIWFFWLCFALGWYWLTASLLPYITHPIRTLRERMFCIDVCRWCKNLWLRFWHWATDVELDENLTRNIWKVVGLNGVIVAFLCCIWFGGVVGAVIYTILLYVLIKKKCGEILEKYEKLLQVTRVMAEGDLNVSTDEDMGVFNPIRDELTCIRNGFRKAVSAEVRSRNMKTELITNVSHDLKTPLTAIITYVDLLKKEDITEEERKGYIETLEKKSQRLKVLIEDLFEVSKATTDNIAMNFDDVDLVSLIKQVRLENEDKIAQSTLDFRWNLPEEKCILTLDPQRTFRVMDNLVQNILKYSMPHSRVYIDMKDDGLEVRVSFKNMSAAEMNFSPEEITERFVRGDLSRNTEGSGLGLAIAQSFTELQGGTFQVETDGDLFKVTITWKK